MIRQFDRDALRAKFQSATPFPHLVVDDFLEEGFAREVAAAYPTYEKATGMGRTFQAVNEVRKVQICDASKFPPAVGKLNELLASKGFLDDLEYITGIPKLIADVDLEGGGMHLTGSGGRLDVHVDFNYVREKQWHRRLNILLYLNEQWYPGWGGALELWDRDVKRCHQVVQPKLNRLAMFATSEISFHGVQPVACPPELRRQSFATYYYTKEPPPGWDGKEHSTIFKARPDEKLRGYVLMPLEKLRREALPQLKQTIKRVIGRD